MTSYSAFPSTQHYNKYSSVIRINGGTSIQEMVFDSSDRYFYSIYGVIVIDRSQ